MTPAATGNHRQASCYTYAPKKGGKKRREWRVHKGTEAKGQEFLQLQKMQGRADEKDEVGGKKWARS